MNFDLDKPIGVFDAGIGSYAIAEKIRLRYPQQDLIYFADRASFPYGTKTKEQLAGVVVAAVRRLAGMGAQAVVLASNAPSVLVLREIRDRLPVPVVGVFPPVSEALRLSRSGRIAVMGVRSMVQSMEIRTYVESEAGTAPVVLVDGSPMVELVESGDFLADPEGVQSKVDAFVGEWRRRSPEVDVCTLSSTHLPWLTSFFEKSAPDVQFIDPAETVIDQVRPFACPGQGKILCIATASPVHTLSGLQQMFDLLGISVQPQLVE